MAIPEFAQRASHLRISEGAFLDWASVLTSSLLGRFKNLRGLVLDLVLCWAQFSLLQQKDVMRNVAWKGQKVPAIIRAFQQHQLEASRTTVTFSKWNTWPAEPRPIAAEGMDVIIKGHLLEYHPRHLSKRGQENEEA